MPHYDEFTFELLIDALVKYNREYTRLLRERGTQTETASCKDMLEFILAELRIRESPAMRRTSLN
jgi:hypothetical protein